MWLCRICAHWSVTLGLGLENRHKECYIFYVKFITIVQVLELTSRVLKALMWYSHSGYHRVACIIDQTDRYRNCGPNLLNHLCLNTSDFPQKPGNLKTIHFEQLFSYE